jgi:hypothetical protein
LFEHLTHDLTPELMHAEAFPSGCIVSHKIVEGLSLPSSPMRAVATSVP